MGAIVTGLFEGSPPCSWGSLLGEGSISLKTTILLLSQWNDNMNCSNLMVALLSGPLDSSLDGIFGFPGWSMILNYIISFGVNYVLMIGTVVMSVIYCDPESGSMMSCSVLRICGTTGVVCYGMICNCDPSVLNGIILSLSCTCPIDMIWNDLCASYNGWSYDVCCI